MGCRQEALGFIMRRDYCLGGCVSDSVVGQICAVLMHPQAAVQKQCCGIGVALSACSTLPHCMCVHACV